jgi:hypothetical protein
MHAHKSMTDRDCWTRLISWGRVTQARAMYTVQLTKVKVSYQVYLVNDILE